MAENNNESLEKAQIFFKRAQEATERKNFDYAVEMYLEGIKCAPDDLENGHLKLYSLGLHRLEKSGKKPTMMEKVKLMRGKDHLEQMINAEHLLAKDPKNFSYAQTMLKAASAGGYEKTAKWVADMIFQHENSAKKPSASTYLLLKGAYEKIKEFDRSLMACQKAVELKPKDGELADEFKRLSAELTVSRGKYDQEGDGDDTRTHFEPIHFFLLCFLLLACSASVTRARRTFQRNVPAAGADAQQRAATVDLARDVLSVELGHRHGKVGLDVAGDGLEVQVEGGAGGENHVHVPGSALYPVLPPRVQAPGEVNLAAGGSERQFHFCSVSHFDGPGARPQVQRAAASIQRQVARDGGEPAGGGTDTHRRHVPGRVLQVKGTI